MIQMQFRRGYVIAALVFGTSIATAEQPEGKPLELKVAQGATLVTSGFQAGWLVGTKLWVSPVRQDLDFPEYARVQGGFNDTIGPVAPFMMAGTALVNVTPLLLIRPPKK